MKEEYVPFAPKQLGAEVHVHHCRQGKDNDRLYIKRDNDGTILAYCHHCGKSGRYDERRSKLHALVASRNPSHADGGAAQGDKLFIPSDALDNLRTWPTEAVRWLKQYGLSDEEIKHVGHITYSPYWGRVILPTFDEKGSLLRWQGRAIHGLTERSPERNRGTLNDRERLPTVRKYHNKNREGATKSQILSGSLYRRHDISGRIDSSVRSPRVLVIVEDIVSAIKTSRIHDCLALQGSSAKLKDLTFVSEYDIIYIYLDNDNIQVKTSQNKLKTALELLVPIVIVVHNTCDPKEESMQTLEEILNVHRNRTITHTEKEGRLPKVPEVHKRDSD